MDATSVCAVNGQSARVASPHCEGQAYIARHVIGGQLNPYTRFQMCGMMWRAVSTRQILLATSHYAVRPPVL
jgi:hypothetical protein